MVELSRIRQIKEDEKEQKSRDLLRARERIEKIVRELKQKELSLHDHKKRCLEIQLKQGTCSRLKLRTKLNFRRLCKVIRRDQKRKE